ncbi:MAG: hypothetical protein AAF467_07080 [Actinomycetota bacterium]
MNDLRNQNRTLSAVPAVDEEPRPARTRPEMPPAEAVDDVDSDHEGSGADETSNGDGTKLSFPVSREVREMPVSASAAVDDEVDAHEGDVGAVDLEPRPRTRARRRTSVEADAPESRPSKRREASEDEDPPEEFEPEQEQFAWYSYDEGEEGPKELKAKSPLLSRAFRSSVG